MNGTRLAFFPRSSCYAGRHSRRRFKVIRAGVMDYEEQAIEFWKSRYYRFAGPPAFILGLYRRRIMIEDR